MNFEITVAMNGNTLQ